MPSTDDSISFDRATDRDVEGAVLVDGLPGYGMVACIVARQIVEQLGLHRYGTVHSERHFPVVSTEAGRLRHPVRVSAGEDPAVVTVQSDVAIPLEAFGPLGRTVVDALEATVERAIFLVELPAAAPEEVGRVSGSASTDEGRRELRDADVPLEAESGLVVGPNGAVASQFFRAGTPTTVLFVRTSSDLASPDPESARRLVEDALDPLVAFDIDTTELVEHSETIRHEMQAIAHQVSQVMGGATADDLAYLRMYY